MSRVAVSPVCLALALACAACSSGTDGGGSQGRDPELVAGAGATSEPIVGGTPTTPVENPEAVLVDLYANGQRYEECSGALIAPQVVLTAGHCVAGATSWVVTAPNAGGLKSTASMGETYDWQADGSDDVNPNEHDVGLLFLDSPITLASYPTIAEAPVPDGSSVVNVGRTLDGEVSSSALFSGQPVVVTNASADGFPFDYESQDVIQAGDSGGPAELPGTHTIVAVASGAGGALEMLARVDLVWSWIEGALTAHATSDGGAAGDDDDDAGAPGDDDDGAACNGTEESGANLSYEQADTIAGTECGVLTSTEQNWFTWSVAAAGVDYDVTLDATDDARVKMWKIVGADYVQVANTSSTEIARESTAPGTYVIAVWSPTGTAQSYSITQTQ